MKRIIILIFLSVLVFIGLYAQEFPLRQTSDVIWNGVQVHTADNCQIVFWSDNSLGSSGIYAQKFTPFGVTVWNQPQLIVSGAINERALCATLSSDQNIVLLWEEYAFGNQARLMAQKLTSNGLTLWGEEGVHVNTDREDLAEVQLVANQTGGAFVISYNWYRNVLFAQQLDMWGNKLWEMDGISLANGNIIKLKNSFKDGAGGFVVQYTQHTTIDNIPSYFLRISASGEVVGNNPLLGAGQFPRSNVTSFPTSDGNFILCHYNDTSANSLVLGKFDASGNSLLPALVNYALPSVGYMEAIKFAEYADGGVAIATKQGTGENITRHIQRFGADLDVMWSPEGVQLSNTGYEGRELSLAVSANDVAWICWNSGGFGDLPQQIIAQAVDTDGNLLWGESGKQLCNNLGIHSIFAYPEHAFFVWNSTSLGYKYLKRQVYNHHGNAFVYPTNETISQTLAGSTSGTLVLSVGDKFFTFWKDSRYGKAQTYYQISDAAGNNILPSNGFALVPSIVYDDYLIKATKMDDTNVALLYSVRGEDGTTVHYLQVVDNSGYRRYPGFGLPIMTGGHSIRDMEVHESGIYLIWKQHDGTVHNIWGQRIADGEMMWGSEGRHIANVTAGTFPGSCYVKGRYFLWTYTHTQHDWIRTNVLLVDEDGNPAQGWLASGIGVFLGQGSDLVFVRDLGLDGEDLLVFGDLQITSSIERGLVQRINSDQTRPWGNHGKAIRPLQPFQNQRVSHVKFADDGMYCVVKDYDNLRLYCDYTVQKMDYEGNRLWGDMGCTVLYNRIPSNTEQLAVFADGAVMYLYMDSLNDSGDHSLFYRSISPAGVADDAGPQLLLDNQYSQANVRVDTWQNTAFVAWNYDQDSSGYFPGESDHTSVWAMLYNHQPTSGDAPVLQPRAALSLSGNYPNPFNPSTTISMDLGSAQSVSLEIYNIKGQLVRRLAQNQTFPAGTHKIVWDGCDDGGRQAASGLYFCRASSQQGISTLKMIMCK